MLASLEAFDSSLSVTPLWETWTPWTPGPQVSLKTASLSSHSSGPLKQTATTETEEGRGDKRKAEEKTQKEAFHIPMYFLMSRWEEGFVN